MINHTNPTAFTHCRNSENILEAKLEELTKINAVLFGSKKENLINFKTLKAAP